MTTATAAVLEGPRELNFREFAIPTVGDDDAVVRVEASGLCGTDYEQYLGGLSFGDGMPIVPGHEVLGHVEAIGATAATRWGVGVGDRITVEPIIPCGVCGGCVEGAFTRCRAALDMACIKAPACGPRFGAGTRRTCTSTREPWFTSCRTTSRQMS